MTSDLCSLPWRISEITEQVFGKIFTVAQHNVLYYGVLNKPVIINPVY